MSGALSQEYRLVYRARPAGVNGCTPIFFALWWPVTVFFYFRLRTGRCCPVPFFHSTRKGVMRTHHMHVPSRTPFSALPAKSGLYDPQFEHDACGVSFVCDIKGRATHDIVSTALGALCNLEHRGATGAQANTGDGAGV